MSSPHPIRIAVNWRLVALLIGSVVLALLALRQFQFVDRYAVNLMCWDQWDLYRPLFSGGGWWASFDYQHGPHRQGVGGIVIRAIAVASRWNSRCDAFAVSFTLTAAAMLGLVLGWLCGARPVTLVIVPLLFFNVRQYQQLVAAANVAHGAMPVLLLMVCCVGWFIPRAWFRFTVISTVTALMIFTGFGLFAGIAIPLILALEILGAVRQADRTRAAMAAVAVAFIAAGWATFAHGYDLDKASGGVHMLWDRPQEYLYFAAIMLANFFGLSEQAGAIAIAVGTIVAAVLIAIVITHAGRLRRLGVVEQPPSVVIFCLAAFSLLYVAYTALGRAMLGWAYGAQSRYVTLMIPAGLAILLHLDGLINGKHWRGARWASITFGLLLAAGTTFLHEADWVYVDWLHNGCQEWKAAYLQTLDINQATAASKFEIHPNPQDLRDRIRFLQERRLNLFADGPG